MSIFHKHKIARGWIVILLVLNLGILSMILWKTFSATPNGATVENDPYQSQQEFYTKELELDKNQQDQLAGLLDQHLKELDQFHAEIKKVKQQVFEQVSVETVDSTFVRARMAVLDELHDKIDWETLAHFRNIRSLLKSEQMERFEKIYHEVLE